VYVKIGDKILCHNLCVTAHMAETGSNMAIPQTSYGTLLLLITHSGGVISITTTAN